MKSIETAKKSFLPKNISFKPFFFLIFLYLFASTGLYFLISPGQKPDIMTPACIYAAETKPLKTLSPAPTAKKQPNLLKSAEILYEQRKYKKAMAEAEKIISQNPNYYEAYYFVGRTLIELKMYKQAQDYLNKALKIKPDFHPARIHLGEAYFESGQYKIALKIYKQVEAMDPSNTDAVLDIGETYVQLEDYNLAEKYLKKAIRMDPEYFSPYNEMGNLCLIRKDYKQAIQYYNKSLGKKPDYTDALIGLGKSYVALKNFDTAEEYLKKAMKINEDYCGEALSTMGDIKTARKDYKEAEKYYKKAIETDEYDAEGYLGLGKLYLITNKPGEAEKAFLQSLKINPQTAFSEEIHYNLALIYVGKKQNEPALKHIELSLISDSSFLEKVKNNPAFKFLREMPQYKKMMKKYETKPNNIL